MFLSLFFGYLAPLFEGAGSKGVDFFAIYRGGAFLLRGRSIYNDMSFISMRGEPYGSPYRYLPFVAETAGVALNALPAW